MFARVFAISFTLSLAIACVPATALADFFTRGHLGYRITFQLTVALWAIVSSALVLTSVTILAFVLATSLA